jgi:DNA-binding CsgD family transcriptional regulator
LSGQVLALVLTGRSNKFVAYELGLAPSTISTCVRTIPAKTGAANRAALLELAEALSSEPAAAAEPSERGRGALPHGEEPDRVAMRPQARVDRQRSANK